MFYQIESGVIFNKRKHKVFYLVMPILKDGYNLLSNLLESLLKSKYPNYILT